MIEHALIAVFLPPSPCGGLFDGKSRKNSVFSPAFFLVFLFFYRPLLHGPPTKPTHGPPRHRVTTLYTPIQEVYYG